MEHVVNIISTVGFPIGMCLLLAWYIYKQDLAHKEEMNKMSEAINNNTLVMQRILDKMEDN